MVRPRSLHRDDRRRGVALGEVRDEGSPGRRQDEGELWCEGGKGSLLWRQSDQEVGVFGEEGDERLRRDVRRIACMAS